MREACLAAMLCVGACDVETSDADVPSGDTDVEVVADTDLDPCVDYTWETVGGPFVSTWCAPCHGVDVKGPRRQGAPASVHFDTEAEAISLAADLAFVATGPAPTMPPAGGPDEATRARFALWVGCVTDR